MITPEYGSPSVTDPNRFWNGFEYVRKELLEHHGMTADGVGIAAEDNGNVDLDPVLTPLTNDVPTQSTSPTLGEAVDPAGYLTYADREPDALSCGPFRSLNGVGLDLFGEHHAMSQEATLRAAMVLLLQAVDPVPDRGGLVETPERARKAWQEWTSGYNIDPASVLKVFEDGAEGCDEMVVLQDIPVYSHCEHHLAPIFGTACVGYLPDKKIVGLSKLNRIVDVFARRLQVQERMTNQIAQALMDHLQPRGVGVVIRARHFCMESRGVKQSGTYTTTSSMHGLFRDDLRVRSEFLALTR